MNLSYPFINRPIASSLIAIGIALAGVVAFKILPVASLPRIEFPTISVQAALPGASPEIMASSVATPLERQLGRIAGVTELTSSSTLGSTRIVIQFDLTRDIDGAARDVQAAINASLSQLPPTLPGLPTYRKVNPADAPIMVLSVTSSIYNKGQMYDAASSILQQKISQIEGVGQVRVGGGSLPGVRIELNPTALNNYNIGLEEVRRAIAASTVNEPKGQIIEGDNMINIVSNEQLFNAADYQPLIIAYRNGRPVRISDVGQALDSVEDLRNAGITNGKPAVVLIIYKQPGANIIETVDKLNSMLPMLEDSIPTAMDLTVVMDRTASIRASLHEVEFTLMLATMLVILVVYFFLGNVRSAIIPSVAVPLSLLGTFAVMQLLDFSLDNLSLMALTIVTGFVVDDAVVVLENISRKIEEGMKPFTAALEGSKEVGFTVLSMSLSLIAVFIPILLMQGIVGRLFREFAITLSIAILMSLFVSLTITPMMSSILLKRHKKIKDNKRGVLQKAKNFYKKSLVWALRHDKTMLAITFGTLVLTIILFMVIPKGFFPQQDAGRIISQMQTEQNMSFQMIEQKLAEYIKIIQNDPAVQCATGFVGSSVATGGNAGSIYIMLKPREVRKLSADEVIARLRKALSHISGAAVYMQAAQDLVIGGRTSNAQFQYTLQANTLQKINEWAPKVMDKIKQIPGIIDINSDQRDKGLQVYLDIDHDAIARYGISPQLLDDTLYDAFGQRQVAILYTAMNQYHVVMEVAPEYWQNPDTLKEIYVSSGDSKQVPLSNLVKSNSSTTMLAVNHQGQFPAVTISFNLMPGHSLGEAVEKIQAAVSELHIPTEVFGTFSGTAQAFQDSLASEPYLILSALLAVYIVLGILYESLIHPITILLTLPSAGVGALLALLITGTDLTIISLIGMILLIGIVKKNAIMMIDFALHAERVRHKTAIGAIFEAAVLRFRPIMMTTLAAMLGALPLALQTGMGSELRRPLGIAIIGGLLVSQMLTLFSTPVIYLKFEYLSLWLKKKWNIDQKSHFGSGTTKPVTEV